MTDALTDVLPPDPTAWLDGMPEYLRESMNELLGAGRSYDEAALVWLTAAADNSATFGTLRPPRGEYLDRVKAELHAFLCGGEQYKQERAQFISTLRNGTHAGATLIAITVSPKLGAASAVLTPVITLLLATVSKISLTAWCKATRSSLEQSSGLTPLVGDVQGPHQLGMGSDVESSVDHPNVAS